MWYVARMTQRISEFDQAVLQAVAHLSGTGYGMPIRQHVLEVLRRPVSIAAIYASLSKFEERGWVTATLGEATAERGGRAKRYYRIEARGQSVLSDARATAERLWGLRPVLT